ncbi:PAS domain S-box protein [bacterium]|nr:PAS domain S-box protein [bacterium]
MDKINKDTVLINCLTAVEYSFDAIEITDLKGMILYVNPSFIKLTGYTKEELIGNNTNILKSDKNKPEIFKEMWAKVLGKEAWRGEIYNRKKDGTNFLSELTIAPILDENGNLVNLLGTQRDVTENRRLEIELKRQNEILEEKILLHTHALQESEKNYRDLLDNSPEMINLIDKNGYFHTANTTQISKLGYNLNELRKMRFVDLCPISERAKLKYFFETVKENGFGVIESKFVDKNGKQMITQVFAKGIYDKNENYTMTRNYVNDITERKSLERHLLQSEKLSAIGQLAVGIAHEVGNPLTSISSIVQILEMESADKFFTDRLVSIRHEINRISAILRNLVDFSRPKKSVVEAVNINDLINETIKIICFDKRAKHIDFVLKLDNSLPKIKLVADELIQVFINLFINAIDAIDEKAGKIQIISTEKEDCAEIKITDNGKGIKESEMSRIFDPFFTTKEIGKGTGLGLWVSLGIVESFNGKILVESKEGEGTEFTILIPINVV